MVKLITSLPDSLQADLDRIRFAVQNMGAHDGQIKTVSAQALLDWADKTLRVLGKWLLDTEQKQLLRLNPWDTFLLYASAYLYDITLLTHPAEAMDDQSQQPFQFAANLEKSHRYDHEHWGNLGIRDSSIAAAVAAICRLVNTRADGGEILANDSERVIDELAVNGPLLAAAIRLAKAMDPKAPSTAAQVYALLPEGARRHVVGRINLQGEDKCALSMGRNRIFWTETQMRHIKRAVRLALAQTTKAFLEALEVQATAPQTRQSIINQLAIFFDFKEVDDAIFAQLGDPIRCIVEKRFRNFVRIHFAHTLRSNGIPEADGHTHQWQQSIIASFRN
jgi:hypothetical protein